MVKNNFQLLLSKVESLPYVIALFLIIVIGIFVFKRPLINLINRIYNVKFKSFVANSVSSDQQNQNETELDNRFIESLKSFDTPTIKQLELDIKTDIQKRGLSDKSETIEVLIRNLAEVYSQYIFVTIYNIIYGSQIFLLEDISEKKQGETKENLKNWYDNALLKFPDFYKAYSYDTYFNYLVNAKLIIQKGDKYFITDLGRDFLTFIARSGKTKIKYY